jgi:hypothetical protein
LGHNKRDLRENEAFPTKFTRAINEPKKTWASLERKMPIMQSKIEGESVW